MNLGTKSKIQQNNCHHQRIRGQWFVQEKLIELGKIIYQRLEGREVYFETFDESGRKIFKKFLNAADILDATAQQVERFLMELNMSEAV